MPTNLTEAEIRKRLEGVCSRPDVRLVVLFGSRTKGHAGATSDIDLGVLVDSHPDAFRPLEDEIADQLRTDAVDVVNLRRASPTLAMAVAREGHVLHERTPGEFAAFASLATRRYGDTAKLRRLRQHGLRAYLAEKGL